MGDYDFAGTTADEGAYYHLLKPEFGCYYKRVHRQMRLAGIASMRHRACKCRSTVYSRMKQAGLRAFCACALGV